MEFKFDIEVPEVKSHATEVTVTCGERSIKIREVQKSDVLNKKLTGGAAGDWLPDWDWRDDYVDKDEDRRHFALPYRTMLKLAKKQVRDWEAQRLIKAAMDEIEVKIQ